MRRLLEATAKYDEIRVVSDNTDANSVKTALRDFFYKYQNQEVEEAFVYFSGHGLYQNDALLCCSDFDQTKPATTAVSNSELDDLLRSVKPTVAVKVIDACQSGSPYIKDANSSFEKAIGSSPINSFICMASSRLDQSSYASASESFFTAKWVDAALSKTEGQVFYRDIQAFLADAFSSTPEQTPFFVNQGTSLEIFGTVTDEMKSIAITRVKSSLPDKSESAQADLILEAITSKDSLFVPHEQAIAAIEKAKESLSKCEIDNQIVKRFYSSSTKTDGKLTGIPRAKSVAAFAEDQGWPKRYFARIHKESYKVRVVRDDFRSFTTPFQTRTSILPENTAEEVRIRPSNLEATEALPFEVAEVSLTSTHPSLPSFSIHIGIVHSLTELMIISTTVRLIQQSWTTKTPELSDVQWRYHSILWKDVVADPSRVWRDALKRGEADVLVFLESLASSNDGDTKNDLQSVSVEVETRPSTRRQVRASR